MGWSSATSSSGPRRATSRVWRSGGEGGSPVSRGRRIRLSCRLPLRSSGCRDRISPRMPTASRSWDSRRWCRCFVCFGVGWKGGRGVYAGDSLGSIGRKAYRTYESFLSTSAMLHLSTSPRRSVEVSLLFMSRPSLSCHAQHRPARKSGPSFTSP